MARPSALALVRLAHRHPRYLENLLTRKLRFAARYRWLEKHPESDDDVPPPLVYKLVLTYRCNLRCSMCYEWGDSGWCKQESSDHAKRELAWSSIEKIFNEHRTEKPSFILIGGEPFLYAHWRKLALKMREERCFAITCTNGTRIDQHLDAYEENPYLTFLVSLDGPQSINDKIRGKGTFDRVVANISRLKALKKPPYVGIQLTLRPENVAFLFEFCQEMVKLKVDWVLINPTWFVSEPQARQYERFMQEKFQVKAKSHLGYLAPYDLDLDEFEKQYARILAARWPIQISCYLKEPSEIRTFVNTPEVPPANRFCYKQWVRMDVTPEGKVSPCILYPDLEFGDLSVQSPMEIWNSPAYAHFRKVRRDEVLPVCSKCDALYLYDAKRKTL